MKNDDPMRALAVVLGRAGSKGVPGKNAAIVGGRPCAAWTIQAALDAGQVEQVLVSTDMEEVADLARDMGAATIDRPAQFASDTATVDDAARDAVRRFDPNGSNPIVILYANVPLRPDGLIDRAVELLTKTGADSVQSYAPVGKYHPWWMTQIDSDTGCVRPWEGDVLNHGVFRRQDLPAVYVPDGGVLVVTRKALFHEITDVPPGPHAFFGRDRRAVLTGEGEVVDIDSQMDLELAGAMLRQAGG